MGLIEMIWGVGALLGGLLLASNRRPFNQVAAIHIAYVVLGGYMVLSGLLPADGFVVFACLTVVGGATCALYNALFVAVIQLNIEAQVLGRVFSLFFSLSTLPSVFGILAAGYLASEFGVATVFVLGGIAIGAIGLLSLLLPRARKSVGN